MSETFPKHICKSHKIILFLIYCGIFSPMMSWAQGFNIYHPAEPSHPWVSEINPAVISAQFSKVSLGLKVFHFGFVPDKNFEIRESHVNASFPFYLPYGIGIGGDLRYFSAGIYSELSGSVMLSRKILDQLAVGLKLGFGRFGFARQDFNLIDANDPLLQGNLARVNLNLGFGAYWNSEQLSVGLGVDHLNRPDIGYQTGAILPQEISTAVGYRFGKVMPTLLLHHDGTYVRYGLAVTFMHERFGLVKFSYENTMPIQLQLQVNLSRDNQLHYGLDLPGSEMNTVSMGSHEVVYTRILGRGPDIQQPEVLLSSDTMRIIQETILRSMEPGLIPQEIERLAELTPQYVQPTASYRNMLVIPTGILSHYETKELQQQRYIRLANEVKRRLKEESKLKLILQVNDGSLADARMFKQYLIQKAILGPEQIGIAKLNPSGNVKLVDFIPGQENQSHKQPVCSVEKLIITFDVPGKTRQVKDWEFVIKTDSNRVIKTYQGTEKLPEQLEWDWKNEWGELVTPGQYFCCLNLKGMSGQEKSSVSKPIQVTRLNRTVMLRFSKEPQYHANKINP